MSGLALVRAAWLSPGEADFDSSDTFMEGLQRGDAFSAVVLGPDVADSVRVAEAVRRLRPDLPIILVTRARAEVDQRLRFSPFAGGELHVLDEAEATRGRLEELLELSRRRSQHRQVLHAAERALASSPPRVVPQAVYVERLLEFAPLGILVAGPSMEVLACNPLGRQLLGVEEEPLGQPLMQVLEPCLAEHVAACLADPGIRSRICSTGGRSVEVSAAPVEGSGGAIVILQDVTHRVEAEGRAREATQELARSNATLRDRNTQLAEARHAADQANRAKSDFLANVSHELRTPLHGVLATVQMLLQTPLSPEQHELTEIVRVSSEGLLAIITELLDFSRLEAGRAVAEDVPFRVDDLVADAMAPSLPLADARGLRFQYRLAPDVPWRVQGGARQIRQVLVNLLGNAVKFTESGHILVHVEWSAPHLRFRVEDTGIGIPTHLHQSVFEPFVQVDASITRRHGGTGLGLAISARLAELLGGTIALQSEPGRGTRVEFTARVGEPREPEAPLPEAVQVWRGRTATVLVADPWQRETLVRLLVLLGLETEAPDPPDLPVRAGDLLVLDLALPSRVMEAECLLVLPAAQQATVPSGLGPRARLRRPVSRKTLVEALEACSGPAGPLAQRRATRPLRVLLAEDNLVNQRVMVKLLERMGHRVTVASDGEQVVQRWREERPDLILMDLQMPVLSGPEAACRIRETEARRGAAAPVPIVALTARLGQDDRELARASGMDDVLGKPVDLEALAALLERLGQ